MDEETYIKATRVLELLRRAIIRAGDEIDDAKELRKMKDDYEGF